MICTKWAKVETVFVVLETRRTLNNMDTWSNKSQLNVNRPWHKIRTGWFLKLFRVSWHWMNLERQVLGNDWTRFLTSWQRNQTGGGWVRSTNVTSVLCPYFPSKNIALGYIPAFLSFPFSSRAGFFQPFNFSSHMLQRTQYREMFLLKARNSSMS